MQCLDLKHIVETRLNIEMLFSVFLNEKHDMLWCINPYLNYISLESHPNAYDEIQHFIDA